MSECPKCGSNYGMALEDGKSYCISCKAFFGDVKSSPMIKKKGKMTEEEIAEEVASVKTLRHMALKDRRVSKEVATFYDVRVSFNNDGEVAKHYYPYGEGVYNVRVVEGKRFYQLHDSLTLFGADKFPPGGKRIVINEGEVDTLSMAEASYGKYHKFYPVVGVKGSNRSDVLLANREYLRSFKEVILMFDDDEAGHKAEADAIRIIGMDKVKVAKLPCKDANQVLLERGSDTLLQCMFEAQPFVPSGIISTEQLWEKLVEYNNTPSVLFPSCLHHVNKKTKGMRKGEITLFVSGTSTGKSTLMREISLHLKETEDTRVGIVALEESPAETARKLSGMVLKRNPANEELSLEDLKPGFDSAFGGNKFMLLDHQGSINDSSIIDKMEYMVLCGCEYLIVDHITILVSEGADKLTGNEATDKVMNDLLRFVKKHNVWIGLVSHLRKTGQTGKSFEEGQMPTLDDIKGSGSIKQISFDIVGFARNLMEEDEELRNTIEIAVLKCRFTGLTGPAGNALYDFQTGRLVEVSEITKL
jgi:twinkle protein